MNDRLAAIATALKIDIDNLDFVAPPAASGTEKARKRKNQASDVIASLSTELNGQLFTLSRDFVNTKDATGKNRKFVQVLPTDPTRRNTLVNTWRDHVGTKLLAENQEEFDNLDRTVMEKLFKAMATQIAAEDKLAATATSAAGAKPSVRAKQTPVAKAGPSAGPAGPASRAQPTPGSAQTLAEDQYMDDPEELEDVNTPYGARLRRRDRDDDPSPSIGGRYDGTTEQPEGTWYSLRRSLSPIAGSVEDRNNSDHDTEKDLALMTSKLMLRESEPLSSPEQFSTAIDYRIRPRQVSGQTIPNIYTQPLGSNFDSKSLLVAGDHARKTSAGSKMSKRSGMPTNARDKPLPTIQTTPPDTFQVSPDLGFRRYAQGPAFGRYREEKEEDSE